MKTPSKIGPPLAALGTAFALLLTAARPGARGAISAAPQVNPAPPPLRRIGKTEKVCQLTGDVDWVTGLPTAALTLTNFNLDACDLGYPVEHDGKLILLFGDSWPPPHGGGKKGEIPPDDSVGETNRAAPPTPADGKCLELSVHHTPVRFAPATIVGPDRVKQGFFNVPSGGVSVGGGLYGFFWTNHCSSPNPLSDAPGNPLARPPAAGACPETNGRNSVGVGVMARSDDDGLTFSNVVPMPNGFVYSTAVNPDPRAGLPADQQLGVFIFAAPRYRASVPYLAYAPIGSFASPGTWRFFTGLGPDGNPVWVSLDEWNRGAGQGDRAQADRERRAGRHGAPSRPVRPDSRQPWNPPGSPELFTTTADSERSVGELSVTWNPVLQKWLMTYGAPEGMVARVAAAPWGPWSDATVLLGLADLSPCELMMAPGGCGNRRDYWPGNHQNGQYVAGGLYAPYVLNRYTTAAAGSAGQASCTIYWVVSTWNPYEVCVMRTTVALGP